MICNTCGLEKTLTVDNWHLDDNGRPRIKDCKACRTAYQREWWYRNREKELLKRRIRTRRTTMTTKDYGDTYAVLTERQRRIVRSKIRQGLPYAKTMNIFSKSNIIRGLVKI